VSIYPFDNSNAGLFVLVNDDDQRTTRPAPADVPAPRQLAYGQTDRAACLDFIEQNWTGIRPLVCASG
jgi:uncharacterized protein YbdZ (MbtH family)